MLIAQLLKQAAITFSDKVALTDGQRKLSFAHVLLRAEATAKHLNSHVKAGDRVVFYLGNSVEFVVFFFACELLGVVRVPLNRRLSQQEVTNILESCRPPVILCDSGTQANAAQAVAGFTALEEGRRISLLDVNDVEQGDDVDLNRLNAITYTQVKDKDIATINYTSGTSGKPKGVMLTHRNWEYVYRNLMSERQISSEDVICYVGPLSHSGGTYLIPAFLAGATSVICKVPEPQAICACVQENRVTFLPIIPTLLTRIVNMEEVHSYDLSSLRLVLYSAERISANTLEKVIDIFGPIAAQNYGLTEAMMTCVSLSAADHIRQGSTGERDSPWSTWKTLSLCRGGASQGKW